MLQLLINQVIQGHSVTRQEAEYLLTADLEALCQGADAIRRARCGDGFDLCTIINGKSGRCSENCSYCAQSCHYPVEIDSYDLLSAAQLTAAAERNYNAGVPRFSIVTSGRALSDDEVDSLCESVRQIAARCPVSLCSSNGLLTGAQFRRLKAAGVSRYHNNLETSRNFFPHICTTHTYDDKLAAIQSAMDAGLTVCSGGIMGLGEQMEDRLDMAFTLRDLGIKSVPVNILNPIKHTPLENHPILPVDEVRRIVAVYRFILPDAFIRLAGGRALFPDRGRCIFMAGANAAISGDMLTVSGISTETDIALIHELGYRVAVP